MHGVSFLINISYLYYAHAAVKLEPEQEKSPNIVMSFNLLGLYQQQHCKSRLNFLLSLCYTCLMPL